MPISFLLFLIYILTEIKFILKNLEILKKIYDIEFIKNFETDEFSKGYLILTNLRIVIKPLNTYNYIIKENISEIFCILVNLNRESEKSIYELNSQNSKEMLVKINRSEHTLELVIKALTKHRIMKIMKKISKYFEYNIGKEIQILNSEIEREEFNFGNSICIDYLNLCYGVIQTHKLGINKTRKTNNRLKNNFDLSDLKKVEVLGEGSNGKVFLFRHEKQNKLYAVKVISKWKILQDDIISLIQNEKFILEHLKSDFLLKLEGFFQTERNVYFITECLEGDLHSLLKSYKERYQNSDNSWEISDNFEKIRQIKPIIPETAVAFYTLSIAIALQSLHDFHFTYRDLKPENVLINKQGYPVLCDFGLSKLLVPIGKAYTICGTPEYFAPEIITSSSYDQRVDWWTLGIIVYELIYGFTPFSDENTFSLYEKILNNPVNFHSNFLVSDEAKDIILKLLNKNQEKRLGSKYGIKELIALPFFSKIDIDKLLDQKVK